MRIVAIKSHFPKGLNESLRLAFPFLPSVEKPEFISFTDDLNPNWVAGFVNGDGSFTLGYALNSRMHLGATCFPRLTITQQERDLFLLERIVPFFGCGAIDQKTDRDVLDLRIIGLSIITNKAVPFFNKILSMEQKLLISVTSAKVSPF